jgi:hypothetical protein
MSAEHPGGGLIDTKQFIFLPGWAKLAIVGAASAFLLLAAFMVWRSLGGEDSADHIVFYLSVAQTAIVVLVSAILILFATRDANVDRLHQLTDAFIAGYVAGALKRVSVPERAIHRVDVQDLGRKDIFGRVLRLSSGQFTFKLWVGLNVHRLFVIYFVPLTDEHSETSLREVFRYTFGGAQASGFKVNFERVEQAPGRQEFVSIWLTTETGADLLFSPREKLFWAQDIAMMTESLLRTAHRARLNLDTGAMDPAPL